MVKHTDIPDQEFDLKPTTPGFKVATKVVVGQKVIRFTDSRTIPGSRSSFTFEKKIWDGVDHVEITACKDQKKMSVQTCNLGHNHMTVSEEPAQFAWLSMSWEQFEQLLEWFQTGKWSEIRTFPKK